MPFLAAAIVGALARAMTSLLGRALLALGIGFTTYKGLDVMLAGLKNQVVAGMSSIPHDAASLLGFLWFDRAVITIMSAYAVALGLRLLGGSVKKMVFK